MAGFGRRGGGGEKGNISRGLCGNMKGVRWSHVKRGEFHVANNTWISGRGW